MSDTLTKNCPCPSPEIVAVPGAQGTPGTNGANGANGVNAFSVTNANFVIPNTGSTVVASVSQVSWNVVGQPVFVSDGTNLAHFQVTAIQTIPPQLTLKALGYNGDTASGNTISSGATVAPGGVQGTSPATPVATQNAAVGGAQALTATPAQALTASVNLSASSPKTYLLFARVRLDYAGATFAANQTVTLTIRRTNNTAGNLVNSTFETAVITTQTYGVAELTAMVPYTSAAGTDTIQPFISVSVAPSAGALNVVEAQITALQLN